MTKSEINKFIKKTIKNKNRQKSVSHDSFHSTKLAKEVKNLPFWIEDEQEHEAKRLETRDKCCLVHLLGLPEKEHLIGKNPDGTEIKERKNHPIYDYEMDALETLFDQRYLRIKKATGLGFTTFFLYLIT